MKKKLLLACVVFGMNATAQNVTVKGHYELNTYKYSKEYCEHNGLDWNYFKNQIKTSWKDGEWVDTNPNIQLVWAPKYFMYNQDTIVLTWAFRDKEIYNCDEINLKEGNYNVEKIAKNVFMLVDDCENCDEID